MTEYQVTRYEDEKCIVRIHKPILTEDERKAREEAVKACTKVFCLNAHTSLRTAFQKPYFITR